MIIPHIHPLDPREGVTLDFLFEQGNQSQEPNHEVPGPKLETRNDQPVPKRPGDLP